MGKRRRRNSNGCDTDCYSSKNYCPSVKISNVFWHSSLRIQRNPQRIGRNNSLVTESGNLSGNFVRRDQLALCSTSQLTAIIRERFRYAFEGSIHPANTSPAIRESSRFHESRERCCSQISSRTKTAENDPRPVFAVF